MKEKSEIKRLSDRIDALTHKRSAIIQAGNSTEMANIDIDIETLQQEIVCLKTQQASQLSKQAQQLKKLPFHRVISKKEQANMGALKKQVPGIKVVHPMTALGREMDIKEVTGFARKLF